MISRRKRWVPRLISPELIHVAQLFSNVVTVDVLNKIIRNSILDLFTSKLVFLLYDP